MKKKQKATGSAARTAAPRAGGMPRQIGVSASGDPIAMPARQPAPAVRSTEEVIDEAWHLYKQGALDGDDDKVLTALGRVDALTHVYFGVDRTQPLFARPQNARQVPEAGRSIASTA